MTLRAFIIGLVLVAGFCLLDPYTSYIRDYGWNSAGHFPVGPVFLLVLLTVVINAGLKWVRRGWAFRQAELMLIWCMLIVASVAPSDGMMRMWFPALAGPAYLARRPDVTWKDTSLAHTPETLLLTKDPKSPAAQQFYEGRREAGRFPLRQWLIPIGCWSALLASFFLATLFLCSILRRQWVDIERLQFPLARVPLEFTEEGRGLLPSLFANRAFVYGVAATAAFRFLRAAPLFFGRDSGWNIAFPFDSALRGTPLEQLYIPDIDLWWIPLGFAYLVPADVSLSIWGFYLFGRAELQTAAWAGSDLHYGGTWSLLMTWQEAGSYLVFTLGALFMARRHLAAVARKALGCGRPADDSAEPVPYGLAFWGFLAAAAGFVAWFTLYGMQWWVAAVFFCLIMSIMLVHARMVAQSGLYVTQLNWRVPTIFHALGGGQVFTARGIVLAEMFHDIFFYGSTAMLSPPAVHSFRISEVFQKGRRLLLPVLCVALLVAGVTSGWTALTQAYSLGAANFSDTWGSVQNPGDIFALSHEVAQRAAWVTEARWLPFTLGAGLTAFVMFMRARFYWWPLHPIGLLAISSWHADRLWLPFLLGWLVKVSFMKFGSGRLTHQARFFFIGLILTESFTNGLSTLVRTVSRGKVPGF